MALHKVPARSPAKFKKKQWCLVDCRGPQPFCAVVDIVLSFCSGLLKWPVYHMVLVFVGATQYPLGGGGGGSGGLRGGGGME